MIFYDNELENDNELEDANNIDQGKIIILYQNYIPTRHVLYGLHITLPYEKSSMMFIWHLTSF